MNWLTWPEELGAPLAADLAASFMAGVGCFAVLWWITRTPGRSLLERRSVPLLATLGAIFLFRCVGWVQHEDSAVRWFAFWPTTVLPLAMALFVEGLLRRHLPLWLKAWALALTVAFVVMHVIPRFDTGPVLRYSWPVGTALTMGLLARQMWLMRNAGLARQEQRLISGVVMASIIATPLMATDSDAWLGALPIRLGSLGGLLFLYALVAPPGGDGLRHTVSGLIRVLVRGVLVASIVFLVVPRAAPHVFGIAFDLSVAMILLFEIFDRLRRRHRNEVDTQLLRWLASAPTEDFEMWRRAIRHAPLVGDALVLDRELLSHYDARALTRVLEKHGPVVSLPRVRAALATAPADEKEGLEQAVALLSVHDATHAGLISANPLRVFATNLPQVAGRDAELHLRVLLRTGQDAAARQVVAR